MKLRYKIGWACLLVLGLALLGLGLAVSHTTPCGTGPVAGEAGAAGAPSMRAEVYRCYGGPDVLHVEAIAKPTPADD